ncbi:HAD family hydrolase [Massilia niastensis]|uniref:HAD family hydrolase n=1 Tax=Massilia niastensis TaxID=544911 RepID=UPI0003654EB2|nr:HAD family hydrolase [Massilia niastensis]
MMGQPAGIVRYTTFVFDCDGVLLDSNRIKTEGFRAVAGRFGAEAAEALVQYHVQHGGISRYRKFEHLLANILHLPAGAEEVQALADAYGEYVEENLLTCAVAPGLPELRKATAGSRWMVVSGGDQAQLRRVLTNRGLAELFDAGIYGSPTTKDDILQRELDAGNLERPALFLGDSRYDHQAAHGAGLDFVFLHQWTEFADWTSYCSHRGLPHLTCIAAVADWLSAAAVPGPQM